MKHSYLEVTYRKGRPLAAYYYLPRRDGDRSERTESVDGGLLVDFSSDGRPIGIEISRMVQPGDTSGNTPGEAMWTQALWLQELSDVVGPRTCYLGLDHPRFRRRPGSTCQG